MFGEIETRCKKINSILCVGLDPHFSELNLPDSASLEERAKACESFCLHLIEETHEFACAFKPNAAFFETLGALGCQVLHRICARIRTLGVPIIYDCKRGDISTTAEAYAEASFSLLQADYVTVHAYMGFDSVLPFLKNNGHGVFVLVKTSNPSSSDFQLVGNPPLFESVALKVAGEWSDKFPDQIGMVVGATDVSALQRVRDLAPTSWILAPGVGFQGGDLIKAVQAGVRESDGFGLIVPISRGISRSELGPKLAAQDFSRLLNQAREASTSSSHKRTKLSGEGELKSHQRDFFSLAIDCGVLTFGKFTLKSGRISPYFFNAGLFNTGQALATLARCYCQAIIRSELEFDVIFGPAYKGIPLVSAIVSELFVTHKRNVPFCYNRKEEKSHGEGGLLVGHTSWPLGTRVLVVDDVITAGTAIRESIQIIQKNGGQVSGLVVALDRQEVVSSESTLSAVESVESEYKFPVTSVANLSDLLVYCAEKEADKLEGIAAYRKQYGVIHKA